MQSHLRLGKAYHEINTNDPRPFLDVSVCYSFYRDVKFCRFQVMNKSKALYVKNASNPYKNLLCLYIHNIIHLIVIKVTVTRFYLHMYEREKEAGHCGAATEPRRGGSGRPGRVGFGTLFPKGMIIGVGPGLERPLDTWPLGLSVHGHL